MLPERLHKYDINLVVPESNRSEGYRADLYIYFKGLKEGIPVEVKWSAVDLNKENQKKYLQKHNGFYLALDEPVESEVEYIQINTSDFSRWVSQNISKLTREAISYQARQDPSSGSGQYWLVFLRGTAHENFARMTRKFPNNTFWAYTQNRHSLRNIFDIQKGDMCLFILGTAPEGMSVSNNENLEFTYSSWYVTEITEPYYMILKGNKGTFYEDGDIPINKRRWPHFTDFVVKEQFESNKRINYGKRQELASVIAESVNYGSGAPAPLSRGLWETVIDRLRHISK